MALEEARGLKEIQDKTLEGSKRHIFEVRAEVVKVKKEGKKREEKRCGDEKKRLTSLSQHLQTEQISTDAT